MTEPDRHKDKLVGLRGVSADKWKRFGQIVGMKGRSPYLAAVIDWVIGDSDTPPVRPADAAKGKTARKAATVAAPEPKPGTSQVAPGRAYPKRP
jgi:hypothetical protein